MSATVAIAHDEQIEKAVAEALGYLDLRDLIGGKRVTIKPNDTWAVRDDISGVTHGDTLRGTIRHLKQFSPKHIVVSGGSGAAQTPDVFEYSGMMEVIREEGVEFRDHNKGPFAKVELDHGPQREVVVNEGLLDVEVLVSLAQLKVHETATVTLTMKNIAMSFPAADYYGHPRSTQHHKNNFYGDMHGFIVGMVKRFPIHLGIIAGHPAMVGLGPLGGKAVETGLIIAGRDAIAVDAVGAQLLGFHAQGVRHLYEAAQLGLGDARVAQLETKGLSLQEAFALFTERVYGGRLDLEHA
ncbi:MAG: DUF362 domain-containing protein [Chloroflexota bacterium]